MGHHNGTVVGGEGKPGNEHREGRAAETQRVTEQRGWRPPPSPQTPCTAGMVPHAFEWTLCFALAKQHNFKTQPNKSFRTLLPPPLHSATFLFPWGTEGLGNFCALVIFSLGLPAAAATYSSSVAAPEPAWLCQSPALPFFRAWILKIPASLKASGIWAPKHFLSHRMPPVKRTDLHLLMPFIITQSPWNRTTKSF